MTINLDWLTDLVGNLVAPLRCGACDQPLRTNALLCADCALSVETCPESSDPIAFGLFGGALAQVIRRIKYGNRPDLARPLGLLLAQSVAIHPASRLVDIVVPVPVPRDRLAERGFNQAALIGSVVAKSIARRFEPMALARARGGSKQAALDRAHRLLNLCNAFQLRRPNAVRGMRVLLIDDVCTTGATIAHCQTALMQAGAQGVVAAVVARVPNIALANESSIDPGTPS